MTKAYQIESVAGVVLGIYVGADEYEAYEALCDDARADPGKDMSGLIFTEVEQTGWIACDYTEGDTLADVPHHELRDTHEAAAADAKRLCLDGVRWVGTDGYLYVDEQD
jgi:hypothetical protein